jgi:hypothetical protein
MLETYDLATHAHRLQVLWQKMEEDDHNNRA